MNLTSVYLVINSLLYLIFGAWCAWRPLTTSQGVGFQISSTQGLVEYTAVYGGMELGLGVFYLLSYFSLDLQKSALLFSLCFYGGIVAFRAVGLLLHGTDIGAGWAFVFIETCMLLSAFFLYW